MTKYIAINYYKLMTYNTINNKHIKNQTINNCFIKYNINNNRHNLNSI